MKTAARFTLALLLLLAAAGCGARPRPAATESAGDRREELASGRIAVSLTASPAAVALDQPLFLTLSLSAPAAFAVQLPPLDDRFEGFRLEGAYEAGVHSENGRTRRDFNIRLTPLPAPEYRLKPMAVTYRESPDGPGGWIKTRPIVFTAVPLPKATGLSPMAPPLPVRPSPREIGLILLLLAVTAGAAYGLYRLIRRAVRAVRLRQMSPRERALLELDQLLHRRLVEQGLIKEFYFELTLVVRRYIERRHGIRAPEQTTEEFLASAGANPRFTPDVLDKLRTFLNAADLVKFAAYQPDREAIPHALNAAREYVGTDSPEPGKEAR